MKQVLFLLNFMVALPVWSAVNVPLTIQEALYPGSAAGVARTADPVTVGIPLPDDPIKGVTDVNQLTLNGATVGQFRVLGRWPSGRIQWVQVDTQATLSAGQKNTAITLTDGGTGNFGGPNLATDNGSTITVSTGAATFTIRKANFDVLDQVVVGSTTVIVSGASQGLVLLGPDPTAAYPGNVTCLPTAGGTACTTVYASSNDTASTCSIEDNGPAMASIKCTGKHVDNAGHAYMSFTVREYFYKGKTNARIVPTLRNADYGTSNTFATAYKGYQSYEVRITPNLTGTLNYSIAAPTTGTGCNGTTCSGTLNQAAGTDSVYLYQAESTLMKFPGWCATGSGCVPMTTLTGYSVVKNGVAVTTGTGSQYPQGWADISDSSGAGVQIGQYQFAAYGNKSLEFRNGGTDVRVGIRAVENNTTSTSTLTPNAPYYQAWPQWTINPDLYLTFHASAPASLPNTYLALQHYLLGRAGFQAYNQAGVFPATATLIDPAVEDSFYTSTGTSAVPALSSGRSCCIQDFGLVDTNTSPLQVWQYYNWPMGSGSNQTEFRWSQLLNYLTRGYTGRYLDSSNFYRFQAGTTFPMSDGFNWRDKSLGERDGFGQPRATSGGGSATRVWHDQEHNHTYGILDYYFLTGDETIHEALLEMKDWFVPSTNFYQDGGQDGYKDCTVSTSGTTVTLGSCGGGFTFSNARFQYQGVSINGAGFVVASVTDPTHMVLTTSAGTQNGVPLVLSGGLSNTRAVGGELMGAARLYRFLTATGDSEAPSVLQQGVNDYITQVTGDLCASGYPAGCDFGPVDGANWSGSGVSRARGLHLANIWGYTSSWCGVSHSYRLAKPFMAGILIQGILELREAKGPSWSEYWNALDLAYGISRWALSEAYVDDGSGRWDVNGFRYEEAFDVPTTCGSAEPGFLPQAQQTVNGHFLVRSMVDGDKNWAQKFAIHLQKDMYSLGMTTSDFGSYQISSVIAALNTSSPTLNAVSPSSVVDNGGGSYTVSWVVPSGAQSYRIKWAAKRIVDWIGYDAVNGVFTGDPSSTIAWFAANNVPSLPAPAAAGTLQSITISTGTTGLTAQNFSIKAYTTGAVLPTTTLVLVSGNNQSGAPGQQLASPFTVKVTDSTGNPVSGAVVTFVVTAGGGTLSTASVTTGALGTASSTLTLGATAGVNTVTATSAGSSITFTATGSTGTAKTITLVSGNSQSGTVGQALSSPFVVKVTDASSNPVSGVSVTFAVTAGGGTVTPATVSSDSQGLASATLTLGSVAGANTVTASSGTLTGSPITFTATGSVASSSGTGITWTKSPSVSSGPNPNDWFVIPYDPISGRTVVYATSGSGIYSTDLFFYKSDTNSWTKTGGTGSLQDRCPADTATQPGDRHPIGQMAVDTKRGFLWIYSGANQVCGQATVTTNGTAVTWVTGGYNGWEFPTSGQLVNQSVYIGGSYYTIASVQDNHHLTLTTSAGVQTTAVKFQIMSGTETSPRYDTYYMSLKGDPTQSAWHQVTPSRFPQANYFASMVYDPDDDVLFAFGLDSGSNAHDNWVYCRTVENSPSGVLTTLQTAAGCTLADDWSEVKVVGSVPPGSSFPAMVYDTVTKKVILFGGQSNTTGTFMNQTWAYDVRQKTWTQKALGTTAPPVDSTAYWAMPALAYVTTTGKVLYHQAGGSGAPADWQYDPVADSWSKLTSTGGGSVTGQCPDCAQVMAYDSGRNVLIGYNRAASGGYELWQGVLSTAASSPVSACDLNGDGVVNGADVQLAISQALGTTACKAVDINSDGSCNIVDVQRVVNAALGGTCRVGQ
jgi:hypothetical protein